MAEERLHKSIDIRGVGCPMNYVKVLMALEDMQPGERLEVTVDDKVALSTIPKSAREDGHKVIEVIPVEGAYRMIIEKGVFSTDIPTPARI
ncbi:MAG: sulfurtransferase TusA family protein [Candidatus Aureabacteria bacterium]|nr:sulfurtransferase TusA family protein [Candidatus Auribacterota bacterium]